MTLEEANEVILKKEAEDLPKQEEVEDSPKQEEAEVITPITPGMAAAQRIARLASERQAAAAVDEALG